MAKLIKNLDIVEPGRIYPITLEAGSECPAWAIEVATQLDILAKPDAPKSTKKAVKAAPENKAITKLETKGR